MDFWLADNLICPKHQTGLAAKDDDLVCLEGCRYPIVEGVPVMLLEDARQTMDLCQVSLRQAREKTGRETLYVESVGLTEKEKAGILCLAKQGDKIDPVVAFLVGATNGIAYEHLIGKLEEYPIPDLRLPPPPRAAGMVLLDIGCNWGRWSIAAARKGYKVIGIDPSLGAIMAARRVASMLGIKASFVVGDARFLPFKSQTIDQTFSYSVIQHFSREDAATTIKELGRVLKNGGSSLVQMPTKVGVRCLYHQARRGFREGERFDVRYWTLPELRRLFSTNVGQTRFSVDCFFGIGLQKSDLHLMRPMLRVAIRLSEFLRRISMIFSPLVWLADSVYVTSIKLDNDVEGQKCRKNTQP